MPKRRIVILGLGFLILTGLAGAVGIIYFGADNNGSTEETMPTDLPLPSATATMVTVDNNSSADLITHEPSATPTIAATEVVATPLNMRTATSAAYQTQIPLTTTALNEAYVGTQEALYQMATSTAAAIAAPTAESSP